MFLIGCSGFDQCTDDSDAFKIKGTQYTYESVNDTGKMGNSNNTCKVVSYAGSNMDVTVPKQCNSNLSSSGSHTWGDFHVVELANTVFSGKGITKLDFEATSYGYTIQESSFLNCKSLTSADLSDLSSLKQINKAVFKNCTSLTSISFPSKLTSIGANAFQNCTSLKDITLPSSLTTIGDYAFQNCTSLKSLNIPTSVTSISSTAFEGCGDITVTYGNYTFLIHGDSSTSELKSCSDNSSTISLEKNHIVKSYSLKAICDYVFKGKTNLTSITMPDTVTSIGSEAFHECTNLNSVHFSTSLAVVNHYAFRKCPLGDASTVISLPESLTTIGSGSFEYTDIGEYKIGKNVVNIQEWAFASCKNLKKFTVDADNSNYCNDDQGILYNKDKTNLIQVPAAITDVKVPSTVTGLTVHAFCDCVNLTTLRMPVEVKASEYTFCNVCNIQSITYFASGSGESAEYEGGWADNKFTGTYTYQPSQKSMNSLQTVVFEDGVKSTAKWMFRTCSKLTSVKIPASLTTISHGTFERCTGLSELVDLIHVNVIGGYAFKDCYGVKNVDLSEIRTIGGYAFYRTDASNPIDHLLIGDNVESIDKDAFNSVRELVIPIDFNALPLAEHITNLEKVTFTPGKTGEGHDYDYNNGNLRNPWYKTVKSVVLSEGIKSIGENGVYNCDGITELNLPASLERISNLWNMNLQTITVAEGNTSFKVMDDGILYSYDGKTLYHAPPAGVSGDIIIPDGVETIGVDSFSYATAVNSVTVADSVEKIGNYAFHMCTGLRFVYGNAAISFIGKCAFKDCSDLAVFECSIFGTVSDKAFYNCATLQNIALGDSSASVSIDSIGEYAFANTALITVNISDIQNLGKGAFSNCIVLENAILSGTTSSLNPSMFDGCRNLETVTVADSVTEFGERAFADCVKLISVQYAGQTIPGLPSTLKCIRSEGFSNCISLKLDDIPESLATIGDKAFFNCDKICGALVFSSESVEVGSEAFADCDGLTDLIILNPGLKVGNDAFKNCTFEMVVIRNESIDDFGGSGSFAGESGLYYGIRNTDVSTLIVLSLGYSFGDETTDEDFDAAERYLFGVEVYALAFGSWNYPETQYIYEEYSENEDIGAKSDFNIFVGEYDPENHGIYLLSNNGTLHIFGRDSNLVNTWDGKIDSLKSYKQFYHGQYTDKMTARSVVNAFVIHSGVKSVGADLFGKRSSDGAVYDSLYRIVIGKDVTSIKENAFTDLPGLMSLCIECEYTPELDVHFLGEGLGSDYISEETGRTLFAIYRNSSQSSWSSFTCYDYDSVSLSSLWSFKDLSVSKDSSSYDSTLYVIKEIGHDELVEPVVFGKGYAYRDTQGLIYNLIDKNGNTVTNTDVEMDSDNSIWKFCDGAESAVICGYFPLFKNDTIAIPDYIVDFKGKKVLVSSMNSDVFSNSQAANIVSLAIEVDLNQTTIDDAASKSDVKTSESNTNIETGEVHNNGSAVTEIIQTIVIGGSDTEKKVMLANCSTSLPAVSKIVVYSNNFKIPSGSLAGCYNLNEIIFHGHVYLENSPFPYDHAMDAIVFRSTVELESGLDGLFEDDQDIAKELAILFFDTETYKIYASDARCGLVYEIDSSGVYSYDDGSRLLFDLDAAGSTAIVGKRSSTSGSDNSVNTSLATRADILIPEYVYDGEFYRVIGFDRYAFYKNQYTETVTFGKFIGCDESEEAPAIWDCTFREMASLKKFDANQYNPYYYNDEFGVLFGNGINVTVHIDDEVKVIPMPTRLIKAPTVMSTYDMTKSVGKYSVVIGDYAFAGSNVTEVILGPQVQVICSHAFYNCTYLKSVSQDKAGETYNVQYYGDSAFENCIRLETVPLSSALWIGSNCFFNTSLKGMLDLSPDLEYVGSMAFARCGNVSAFRISSSVDGNGTRFVTKDGVLYKKVDGNHFSVLVQYPVGSQTKSMDMTGMQILEIAPYAFYGAKYLETVVMSDDTVIVGREAFAECSSLKSFTIGLNYFGSKDTVSEDKSDLSGMYTYNMFGNDRALTEIKVRSTEDMDNVWFCTDTNGVLYSKDLKTLYCYPAGLQRVNYTVSSETETIYDCAFSDNTNIVRVIMPERLTYIGSSAFANCTVLIEIFYKSDDVPGTGYKIYDNISDDAKSYYYEDTTAVKTYQDRTWQGVPVVSFKTISELSDQTTDVDTYTFVIRGSDGNSVAGADVYIYVDGRQTPVHVKTDSTGIANVALTEMVDIETEIVSAHEVVFEDSEGNEVTVVVDAAEVTSVEYPDLRIRILKTDYMPYDQEIVLDRTMSISYITIAMAPSVEGVSLDDKSISSEQVLLDIEECRAHYSESECLELGLTYFSEQVCGFWNTYLTVVGYHDILYQPHSCIIYQDNGKQRVFEQTLDECNTYSSGKYSSSTYTFKLDLSKIKANLPIYAEFTVEEITNPDNTAICNCLLNIEVVDICVEFDNADEDSLVSALSSSIPKAIESSTENAVDTSSNIQTIFDWKQLLAGGYALSKNNWEVTVDKEGKQYSINIAYSKEKSVYAATHDCEQGYKKDSTHGTFHRHYPATENGTAYEVDMYFTKNSVKQIRVSYYMCEVKVGAEKSVVYGCVPVKGTSNADFSIYQANVFLCAKNAVKHWLNHETDKIEMHSITTGLAKMYVQNTSIKTSSEKSVGFRIEAGLVLDFSGSPENPVKVSSTLQAVLHVGIEINVVVPIGGIVSAPIDIKVEGSAGIKATINWTSLWENVRIDKVYDDVLCAMFQESSIALIGDGSLTIDFGIGVGPVKVQVRGIISTELCIPLWDKIYLEGKYPAYWWVKGDGGIVVKVFCFEKYFSLTKTFFGAEDLTTYIIGKPENVNGISNEMIAYALANAILSTDPEYSGTIDPATRIVDVSITDSVSGRDSSEILRICLDNVDAESSDESLFGLIYYKWTGSTWEKIACSNEDASIVSFNVFEVNGDKYVVYTCQTAGGSNEDLTQSMTNTLVKVVSLSSILSGSVDEEITIVEPSDSDHTHYKPDYSAGADGNDTYVVWIEDTEDNIWGVSSYSYESSDGTSHIVPSDSHFLWYKEVSDGEPILVTPSGLPTILSLVALDDGYIAVLVDVDGDLSTYDDHTLRFFHKDQEINCDDLGEAVIRAMEKASGTSVYCYDYASDSLIELYVSNGKFNIRTLFDNAGTELASGFTVLTDEDGSAMILYAGSKTVDSADGSINGAIMCARVYESGIWCQSVEVCDVPKADGAYADYSISNYSATRFGNQIILAIDYKEFIKDEFGEMQTKLHQSTLVLDICSDICISDTIDYFNSRLTVEITNNGLVSSTVSIFGEDLVILPGMTTSVSKDTRLISEGGMKEIFTYSAKIDGVESTRSVDPRFVDIEVQAKQVISGELEYLVVMIKNNGTLDSEPIDLLVSYDSAENALNKPCAALHCEYLGAGMVKYYELAISSDILPEGHEILALATICSSEDPISSNNSCIVSYVHIEGKVAPNSASVLGSRFDPILDRTRLNFDPNVSSSVLPGITVIHDGNSSVNNVFLDNTELAYAVEKDPDSDKKFTLYISSEVFTDLPSGYYELSLEFVNENSQKHAVVLYVIVADREYDVIWTIGDVEYRSGETTSEGDVPTIGLEESELESLVHKEPDGYCTYTFVGWSDTPDGEVIANLSPITFEDGDKSGKFTRRFYAVYSESWENNCTLKYILKEGTDDTEELSFTETHYCYSWASYAGKLMPDQTGWYVLDADGNPGEYISADKRFKVTKDMALVAAYRPIYHVTWLDEDGSLLHEEMIAEESMPDYNVKPVKESDVKYTYTFSSWDKDYAPIMQDTAYQAVYTKEINNYQITWLSDDGETVLYKESFEYGSKPEYKGLVPEKSQTIGYNYKFSGWDKTIDSVVSDDTITAVFEVMPQMYSVTWEFENGSEPLVVKVAYGTMPSKPDTPVKTSTVKIDYVFASWSPSVDLVSGDVTYKAQYTENPIEYTVTWDFANGSQKLISKERYGVTPTIPSDPSKPADLEYTYYFKSWSPSVSKVTGDTVYQAVYTKVINNYQITWLSYDGETVLYTESFEYGSKPEYGGSVPEKSQTSRYTFKFTGWDKTIDSVVSDDTITAVFDAVTRTYDVTWEFENGSEPLVVKVAYGTMPSKPDTPVKTSTVEIGYEFAGWSPSVDLVSGDVTYKAQYTENPIEYTVTWDFANGSQKLISKERYGVTPTIPSDPSKPADLEYTYYFKSWSPSVSKVTGDTVYTAAYDAVPIKYTISWFNEDGYTLLDKTEEKYGALPETSVVPTKSSDQVYDYTFSGWSGGITLVDSNRSYVASFESSYHLYTIQWVTFGNTVLHEEKLPYGKAIGTYPADPESILSGNYRYDFSGWSVQPGVSVDGDMKIIAEYKGVYTGFDDSVAANEVVLNGNSSDTFIVAKEAVESWKSKAQSSEIDEVTVNLPKGSISLDRVTVSNLDSSKDMVFSLSLSDSRVDTAETSPAYSVTIGDKPLAGKATVAIDYSLSEGELTDNFAVGYSNSSDGMSTVGASFNDAGKVSFTTSLSSMDYAIIHKNPESQEKIDYLPWIITVVVSIFAIGTIVIRRH